MRNILFLLLFLFSSSAECLTVDEFLHNHKKSYQDVVVNGKTILSGHRICEERYELINPILKNIKYPFMALDIGAAQGYFTFKSLHDFPQSKFLMIEGDIYKGFIETLKEICDLNANKNVGLIAKRLTIEELYELSNNCHFDVILALTVLHQFSEKLIEKTAILEILKKMGDNIIIEVPNNVDIEFYIYMENLAEKKGCIFLGELERYKEFSHQITSKFYLLKGYS